MTQLTAPTETTSAAAPGNARRWALHLKKLISSQLRVNIASGFVTTAVNVLLMIVSYPLYLHYLGYEKVGIWLVLSSVQHFAQLGILGIGPALTKLVAEERGRADTEGAQRYVSLATIMVSITGAIAVIALCAFRIPVVRLLGLSGANAALGVKLLPFMGLLTALAFLNQVVISALAGVGRMDISNYCATVAKVAALGLEITLLWRGWGVETLLLGDVLGCCVIHVMGHVYLHRHAGIRMLCRHSWDATRFSRLLSFAGSIFVASLTSLLMAPLSKIALSNYAGVALVPVFDIAFNGTVQLRSMAEVGLSALMPAVSQRSAAATAESRRDVRRLYQRALLAVLVIVPPAYFLAVLVARPLLKLWLRSRFEPQIVMAFDILWASALVSLVAVPAYYVLMATNGVRICMISHIVGAVTNVTCVAGCVALHEPVSLRVVGFAMLASTTLQSVYLMVSNRLAMGPPEPRISGPTGVLEPALEAC